MFVAISGCLFVLVVSLLSDIGERNFFIFSDVCSLSNRHFLAAQVNALSCLEIKQLGAGAKFSMEELKTLKEEDFTSCLVFLGKDPLGYAEGKYIWDSLIQVIQT